MYYHFQAEKMIVQTEKLKIDTGNTKKYAVVATAKSHLQRKSENTRTVWFMLTVTCGKKRGSGEFQIVIKKEGEDDGTMKYSKYRKKLYFDVPIFLGSSNGSKAGINHYNTLEDFIHRLEDKKTDCSADEFNGSIDFFF